MIKEIELHNYKSLKKIKINLLFPINAVIGKTGAGKTNVLTGIYTACMLAFSGKIPKDNDLNVTKGFFIKIIFTIKEYTLIYSFGYYGKKKASIIDSLYIVEQGKKVELLKKIDEYKMRIFGCKSPLFIPIDSSALNAVKNALLLEERPDYLKTISNYENIIAAILLDMSRVKFISLFSIREPALFSISDFEQYLKDKQVKDNNLEFSFQLYDFFKNNSDRFYDFKTLLKSLELIDDIELSEINAKNEKGESFEFNIWRFKVFGKSFPFSWLPFGTRRIINILFVLLYEKTPLLIIQEPETSVHYGLFFKLLAILYKYAEDKRIIISTYSEQILNHISPDQIVYLYNSGGITKSKEIKEKSLHKYLTSDSSKSKFKSKIVELGSRAKKLIGW